MKITTVICDIDGTLMPPSHGIVLHNDVADALLALQDAGVILILASARALPGIIPVAKQLHMETYGGYIIACNGTLAYDCKHASTLFCHEITKTDALEIAAWVQNYRLAYAVSLPDKMVATGFCDGFVSDHKSCDIAYLISDHLHRYIDGPIMKCCATASKDVLDAVFYDLKNEIETHFPYTVVRSTPDFIDIVKRGCTKANACAQLQSHYNFSFARAAAIGDGDSDASLLSCCALSATLENGSALCKQQADLIVKDCYQNGCIDLFHAIMKMNQQN